MLDDHGTRDAATADSGAPHCDDRGAVSHVRLSSAPTTPNPTGTGGTPSRVDGGHLISLPTDPCVTYTPPDCPGPPRPIFGCPIVEGPNRSPTIHPGDAITVKLEISDDGLAAYACAGVGTESPLTDGQALFYAVRPAYVQEAGRIPPSTPSGTVMHFTALASGSRGGNSCWRDLTQMDFDVTVE